MISMNKGLMNVKSIINSLQFRYARKNSNRYVAYLRKKGVRIGGGQSSDLLKRLR